MKYSLFSILLSGVLSSSLCAEQLLEQGGFEWPLVVTRKSKSEGADLTQVPVPTEWARMSDKSDAAGGKLLIGLSNEAFRTGRQSMYVHFDKLTAPNASAQLSSDLIPVLPGKPYRIAMWGQIDKKLPLTKDQRLPFLKLRVDWFTAAKDEQTAEPEWKLQPIPGSKNRPAMFVQDRWSEYFANVKSPEDAAYVKITWFFEAPAQEGETDGIIFFDDATLEGERGPKEADPGEEAMKEITGPDESAEAAEVPGADGVVPLSPPVDKKARVPEVKPEVKKP